jgi:signal transduction histidine kinase
VLLFRHAALCAAAALACVAREQLGAGDSVLGVLGFAAILNLVTALLSRRPRMGPLALFYSPVLGLAGWVALMLLTGGLASPFVAGLLLEIVLAGFTGSPASVALATGAGTVGLWLVRALGENDDSWLLPVLQAGFLLATGAVAAHWAGRWQDLRRQLRRRQDEIRRRLAHLESDLEAAQRLGSLGENAARLAHGLKNSVHSLRGHTRLLEARHALSAADRDLIDGLTIAIDGLEDLARATLGSIHPVSRPAPASTRASGDGVVREVVKDVGSVFPEIRWSLPATDLPAEAGPWRADLREVLTILVRNAAEALHGRGEVGVETGRRNGTLEICVWDTGPGLPPSVHDVAFQPGRTTKPDGHGLGLFLARRLVEARGGLLSHSSEESGGTRFRIQLPLTAGTRHHDESIRSDR